MGYYFIKEKRTTLDASEMSEGESSLLALGTIGIVFLIILAYVSVFVAVALITVNMGALFRNHGKKFVLCLVPFYNLYLCSKLLVKNGWILWGDTYYTSGDAGMCKWRLFHFHGISYWQYHPLLYRVNFKFCIDRLL